MDAFPSAFNVSYQDPEPVSWWTTCCSGIHEYKLY